MSNYKACELAFVVERNVNCTCLGQFSDSSEIKILVILTSFNWSSEIQTGGLLQLIEYV